MSNYRAPALNPKTGRVENADFVDNYFARHEYAVKFDDGQIARPWEVDILAAGQLIEKMRAALIPFAEVADDFDADGRDMADDVGIYANTAGDFRRARAALSAQEME